MTTNEVNPTAELVEGPYYGNGGPIRQDIREDQAGATLELEIQAISVDDGEPMPSLKIDTWHSNATGHYSGYEFDPDSQPYDVSAQLPENDEVWLRGAQITNGNGVVRFTTIYVGWYATRAPHIHLKVFRDDTCLLTTQLFLPEGRSSEVYDRPEYDRSVNQDTHNQTDTVIALSPNGAQGCWVDVRKEGQTYHGTAILGVDPNAESVPFEPPPGFQPPLGGVPHNHQIK